jgi:hypothetical protein
MSRRITAALIAGALTLVLATAGASGGSSSPGQQIPKNLTPPLISGSAQVPNTLTASKGTWQGKALKYAYQWLRCDSTGAACGAIGGATTSTKALSTADVGKTLRVIVTASNRKGSAAATSAQTAVVVSAPSLSPPPPPTPVLPSNTSPPTISGTAQQGQTLTSATGSWSGTTPITYSYQWQRCASTGASCAPISGATSSSYVLASADVGSTMRVSVTASNTAGSATASSLATAVVTTGTSTAPSYAGIGIVRYAGTMCSTYNLSQYAWLDSGSDTTSWTCAARQPGLALGYFNPVQICTVQNNGVLYSVADSSHEDWFLHTSGGARISVSNGGGTCYLSDPGNSDFQNEFKTQVAARFASISGADGVFLDNVHNHWNNFNLSGAPSKYPTDSTGHSPGWEAAMKSFLTNVSTYLRGRGAYVVGNAGAWCNCGGSQNNGSLDRWWWSYLTDADGKSLFSGIFKENWMKPSSSSTVRLVGTDAWYKQWDSYAKEQSYVQSLGADFAGEDSVNTVGSLNAVTVARFSRATFLLEYNCGRGAWVWNSGSSDPWSTINHTAVGCPLGDKFQVATNVWRRNFQNGYVIVNPTGSGVTVNGLTIQSGDAVIAQ